MFGLFKKKVSPPTVDELQTLTAMACEDIKAKWLCFDGKVHFKTGVPLSFKIDAFAESAHVFFKSKYSSLLLASSELFWLTIFKAVLQSNTHPKGEVNAAIAELELKHKLTVSASSVGLPPFYYKDVYAAFEDACKFMDCPLHEGLSCLRSC